MTEQRTLIQKLTGLLRKARVPRFLHHFGPRKFTTWQHLKCVFLKERLKLDWRGLVELLPYFGIKKVPHFTTLIKFAKRMPAWLWTALLQWSSAVETCLVGAIDATGLSRTAASLYYVKRIDRETLLQRYVKLSLLVDVQRRRVLAARLRAKPVHDVRDIIYLTTHSKVLPETNLLDKGYDSQKVHAYFRNQGVYSIIPVRKRCKRGQYRKEMRDHFDHSQYWQRNLAETVISSIKRKYGSHLKSKYIRSQRSETYARLILHNISQAYAWLIARLFHQSL